LEKNILLGEGRDAEVFLFGKNQVLKLFRKDVSIERIDFEYSVSELVQKHYQYTPKVFGKIEESGRQGILYEFIDGKTMNENIMKHKLKIRTFGKCLGTLHANLHKQKTSKIRSQKPYFEQRIRNTSFLTNSQKEIIIKYLYSLKDGESFCHGDLHPDNVLISKNAPFVIDWSNLTIGNPHADIARTTFLLKKSFDPNNSELSSVYRAIVRVYRSLFYRIYYKSYRKIRRISKKEVVAWELIICAVRLSEDISEELDYLLTRINHNLRKLIKDKSS
jgi:aminoglycoside phosphotransferase (APT) family kinase protein